MFELKDSVNVVVDIDEEKKVYYMFLGKGAVGKTYLGNVFARRSAYEPVYVKTFKDGDIYERGNKDTAKVMLYDRLDMYFDDTIVEEINRYGNDKHILLDIKDFSKIDESDLKPNWGFVGIDLGDSSIVVRAL